MAQQGGNCSLGVRKTQPGQAVNWTSHPTQSLGTLETAPEPPASQEDLHQSVGDFRRASWPASSDGGDRAKIVYGENINGEGCGWFWWNCVFHEDCLDTMPTFRRNRLLSALCPTISEHLYCFTVPVWLFICWCQLLVTQYLKHGPCKILKITGRSKDFLVLLSLPHAVLRVIIVFIFVYIFPDWYQ